MPAMNGKPKGLSLQAPRISAVTVLVGIVMLLVPALAYMQYQWLGQLSQAERERMQRTLRTAAAQFATEFDGELSRALVSLQVDGPTIRDENWSAFAQRYSAWTSSASDPRLVEEVLLVDTASAAAWSSPISAPVPVERLRLRRWNNQSLIFEGAEWTPDLAEVRESLAAHFIGFQLDRSERRGPGPRAALSTDLRGTFSFSVANDHLLVSPVTFVELFDSRRSPRITILGFTILKLNRTVIKDTVLASLTARHFNRQDEEVDYRVAIVHRDDPNTVVWESEPGVAAAIAQAPDVSQTFMAARADQMLMLARNSRGDIPPPPPPPPPGGRSSRPEIPPQPTRSDKIVVSMIEKDQQHGTTRMITRGGPFDGRWMLLAKHRSGSLEAAVAAVRQRNLIVSSSVLLLLTLAIGLIVVSARRAQELARQQMEFVAAVSHELRTPVSVIGAAAGNLADGVVGDPQRVRKYGETIQGEARRLGETVERVLQLAGIAAGRAAAVQVPVHPEELVTQSLAACRAEIDTAAVTVETHIADGLPHVLGDATAMRSALQNLISNAVKYGGPAKWIRISAKSREPESFETALRARGRHRGKMVSFTVEDHGPGIDPEDRKHIFEPFYRGRDAVSQQIHGSGLGLNLVARIAEAHGGLVTLSSAPGKGSTFSLSLPAADGAATETSVVEAGLQTRLSS